MSAQLAWGGSLREVRFAIGRFVAGQPPSSGVEKKGAMSEFKKVQTAAETTAQGRLDAAMAGCPVHALRAKLKDAGLRPTRQRMALGLLLFAKGDRHLTAEKLYEEAQELRVPVSLATVYNGLHVFTEAGLLREVAVDGTKVYYDTNVSDHHHFLLEDRNVLIDIPALSIDRSVVPDLPDGMEIAAIDVVVRLRPKGAGRAEARSRLSASAGDFAALGKLD